MVVVDEHGRNVSIVKPNRLIGCDMYRLSSQIGLTESAGHDHQAKTALELSTNMVDPRGPRSKHKVL